MELREQEKERKREEARKKSESETEERELKLAEERETEIERKMVIKQTNMANMHCALCCRQVHYVKTHYSFLSLGS